MSSIEHVPAAGVAPLADHEWAALERLVPVLAKAPGRFRGQPDQLLAVAVTVHSLGMPVNLNTVNQFYVVDGVVSPMAQAMVSLAYMRGHELWLPDEECDENSATAYGRRRGSDRVHSRTFTIEDARRASLLEKSNWQRYAPDMLKARAATRVCKAAFPDALMGLPDLEHGVPVQPRAATAPAGEWVPDDDEPVDAELVDDTREQHGTARAPGSPLGGAGSTPASRSEEPGPDPAAAARSERGHLHAASGQIPRGQWRAAWASAWRERNLPSPHDLSDEDLPYGWHLVRQFRALAALDAAGVRTDRGRHDVVSKATGGATSSTKELSAEQLDAVLEHCERLVDEKAFEAEAGQ